MTTILMILAGAVVAMAMQNRRLSSQIAALLDRQEQTEQQLDRLSKRSKKATNAARRQEQKIERLHRKQREQADRQKRIEAEQKKQAQNISKLSFRLSQAEADIQHQQGRLTQLFALMDVVQSEQAAALPGSRQDVSAQKQIISLENQIATCEKRIRKAEFDRSQAQEALAA